MQKIKHDRVKCEVKMLTLPAHTEQFFLMYGWYTVQYFQNWQCMSKRMTKLIKIKFSIKLSNNSPAYTTYWQLLEKHIQRKSVVKIKYYTFMCDVKRKAYLDILERTQTVYIPSDTFF